MIIFMRKFFSIFVLFVVMALFSCSNDFDLTTDWKDIPIVYGIISLQDTAHYIRVEKAFLDPETDAVKSAAISDSLYYKDLVVQLIKGNTNEVFELERVDGALEGYPKKSGVFADSPNYLYKIKADVINFSGGERATLKLIRGNGKDDIVTSCTVVDEVTEQSGKPGNHLAFSFKTKTPLGFRPQRSGRIFDLSVLMRYREYNVNDPSNVVNKQIIIPIKKGILNESNEPQINYLYDGTNFFYYLRDHLETSEDIHRILRKFDYIVVGGGVEFADLAVLGEANYGATGSQELPVYTNIPGGLGIFSSIYTMRKQNLDLAIPTLQELRENDITKQLNFD